jgi:hypothetical protein
MNYENKLLYLFVLKKVVQRHLRLDKKNDFG